MKEEKKRKKKGGAGASTSARPEDIANWEKANKDSFQPYAERHPRGVE